MTQLGLLVLSVGLVHANIAVAQDSPKQTLLVLVHVFDDVSENRVENARVRVEGNTIKAPC